MLGVILALLLFLEYYPTVIKPNNFSAPSQRSIVCYDKNAQ